MTLIMTSTENLQKDWKTNVCVMSKNKGKCVSVAHFTGLGHISHILQFKYSTKKLLNFPLGKKKKKKHLTISSILFSLMCTCVRSFCSLGLWGKTNTVHNKSLVYFLNKHGQDLTLAEAPSLWIVKTKLPGN